MERKFPRKVKRVVIKVGSSLLATHLMKPHEVSLRSLVTQICDLQDKGVEVVFVSSGAIALGLGEMGENKRPSDTPSLQAAAAVGQALLMRLYGDLFKKRGRVCAQVLLTWDDFESKVRHSNACNTLQKLLSRGIVPVINENDTISIDEIKFGDNDKLSAMVAAMVHADLLIMLSDVDGLYKKEGGKLTEKFSEVREITAEIKSVAGGARDRNFSKGGMITKVNAVEVASRADVPCIIANGQTPDVVRRIVLDKESLGTYFFEKEQSLIAHKHWICFSAKPKGFVTVDDGAARAILKGNASLLLPGIIAVEGKFAVGDAIVVQNEKGIELARGIADYAKEHLDEVSDKKAKKPFIHIDNLVVTA